MGAPLVSLAVAMDRRRLIGRDGSLPWHITEDLRHFKALTWGKPVLMGRRTFEAIGRALPGRRNVVITRDRGLRVQGCELAHSLQEALALCAGSEEIVVIGGGDIYAQALPLAGRLYITQVEAEVEGDTWFPDYDPSQWQVVQSEGPFPSATSPYEFRFLVLERRPAHPAA